MRALYRNHEGWSPAEGLTGFVLKIVDTASLNYNVVSTINKKNEVRPILMIVASVLYHIDNIIKHTTRQNIVMKHYPLVSAL